MPSVLALPKISNAIQGLTADQAAQRLRQEGPNELPRAGQVASSLRLARDVFLEPMTLLLLASGGLYLVLGDRQEALMLMSFVVFLMAITFFQKHKTERSLEALRDMSSPRASVVRDGAQLRIPGREVVQGDWVLLAEGDRIPADGQLVEARGLLVDESMLTGESLAVRKSLAAEGDPAREEDLSKVYSGTLVVQGNGVMQVTATGAKTEMGKIGARLQSLVLEKSSLQRQIAQFIKWFAIGGFLLSALLVLVFGVNTGNWLKGLLAGITLAMTIIPEEFPVVMTIFMALGAWRLSQQSVLTRHIPVVETLGAITVLCVDKTGTLTQNQMRVQALYANEAFFEVDMSQPQVLPEAFHAVLEYSILASQQTPFEPMEVAFAQLGNHFLADTEHLHTDWDLVHEYPLSRELMAMSRVWRDVDNPHEWMIAAKGAPETIFDLCHLSEEAQAHWLVTIEAMARRGLRVLAVAQARFAQSQSLPPIQHDFDFALLGLIALADPIRPSVPEAIAQCKSAGIRVVMMTGDYPQTASEIARQIDLPSPDLVITGEALRQLSPEALQEAVKQTSVFARVLPEDKLRLVNALKANGEVVAMTGDGVNDAPALKSAHVGIAMGARGTDVAREAASLVLTNDDFASIVYAIRQGRSVYANLQRAIAYILAIHLPIVGLSFIPVLIHWPLVLLPVHVAFLHLIIDPACSIVFESQPPAPDTMGKPPRPIHQGIMTRSVVGYSVFAGLSILLVVLGVYGVGLAWGHSELSARGLAFATLIVSNLALITVTRSLHAGWRALISFQNPSLFWVLFSTLMFLALVLFWPPAVKLFQFGPLHTGDLTFSLIVGVVTIVLMHGVSGLFSRGANVTTHGPNR